MIKSRRMRLAGYVVCMGNVRIARKFSVSLKGSGHFENLNINGDDIKMEFKEGRWCGIN
jgi:hypothetical protein